MQKARETGSVRWFKGTEPLEIPDSLRTFDFCLAWEEFKAHFDAINERYWLHHFELIGIEESLREIKLEIENTKRWGRM